LWQRSIGTVVGGLLLHIATRPVESPPASCEVIDRSAEDTLSRSIFDFRDMLAGWEGTSRDAQIAGLDGTSRDAKLERFRAQLAGLRVIECGYINEFFHKSSDGRISAPMLRELSDRVDALVIWELDPRWSAKIVAHDFSRRVMFEGTFSADDSWWDLHLDHCRILRVE
jgi:hypothetical protein